MSDELRLISLGHFPSKKWGNEYFLGEIKSEKIIKKDEYSLIVYWYGCGNWEGAGQAIVRHKNGFWSLHDLGHCSCYNPEENFEGHCSLYESLEELNNSCSEDLKEDIKELIELAKGVA